MLLALLAALLIWIAADIYWPYKTDIKKVNAPELARLDGAMWKSYYEKKQLTLFWQTAELMRGQFHVPFWRSNVMALHAARAAFIFKKGTSMAEYDKALPELKKYFANVNAISTVSFNIDTAARLELRWWVVRRYREQHPPAEWETVIADAAAAIYHVNAAKFAAYAHLRTMAMLLRDDKGDNITAADWRQIDGLLQQAWASFADALKA